MEGETSRRGLRLAALILLAVGVASFPMFSALGADGLNNEELSSGPSLGEESLEGTEDFGEESNDENDAPENEEFDGSQDSSLEGSSTLPEAPANPSGSVTEESAATEDAPSSPDDGLTMREKLDKLAALHVSDLPEGQYAISSLQGTVLDAYSAGKTNGTVVQLYASNNTDAQVWRVEKDEQGYITFVNVNSGLVLDVQNGQAKAGSRVHLWESNDTYAQKWIAVLKEDGTYELISALSGDLILGTPAGEMGQGARVQLCELDVDTQTWAFAEAKTVRERIDALATERRDDLPDGTYVLRSALLNTNVVDISGGSTRDAANAQMYAYNGTAAQRWNVTHDETGYVVLTNQGSGKVLDVSGGSAASGANVQQYSSNGTYAQKWIAVSSEDGSVTLYSALGENLVLDVSGASVVNGANVQLWSANASKAQLWAFEDTKAIRDALDALAEQNADLVADGAYIITSDLGSEKVVDVSGASGANGANVQLYTSNMTNAQKWRVSHDSLGYVTLENVSSGKVLDVSGGSSLQGTNVQQYASNGSYAQKWIIAPSDSSAGMKIVSALHPSLVLDVKNGSATDCANVQIYGDNGTKAQLFSFIEANPHVAPCEDILPKGWFELAASANPSYVVDVSAASKENGANVQLYSANGSLAQTYKFVYHDGYYSIVAASSGKSLDVADGDMVPPTNVQQWASDDVNANQLFSVIANDDGSYTFINKATGLALDISGGAMSNGANVQVYTKNDSAAQRFVLRERVNVLPEGFYDIAPVLGSQRSLDVQSGSRNEGVGIQVYESNGTLAQKWLLKLVEGSDNTYTLENLGSGLLLTALEDGTVVQSASSGSDAQYWEPMIAESGSVIFENLGMGKVLDVKEASLASGASVQVFDSNGTDAQRFYFTSTSVLSADTYVIQACTNTSMVLDVESGSNDDYANVRMWEFNDSGAQKWEISSNGDGTYTILNAKSGKALDVQNGSSASGANVQQYAPNSSLAQKWKVSYEGTGSFKLVSALDSSLVLSYAGEPASSGTNVIIATDEGLSSQRFTFKETTYQSDKVLGVDRSRLVSWLESHEYDGYYLGTPFATFPSGFGPDSCMYPNGSPRWDGYVGMNCAGFVAHAYQSAGGNLAVIGVNNNHSPYVGGPGSGSYINAYRWYGYAVDSGAEIHAFRTVSAMLASGLAEKGDIIFFYPDNGWVDCHIGIFWGDSPSENKIWHQIVPQNCMSACFNNANKAEIGQTVYLIK